MKETTNKDANSFARQEYVAPVLEVRIFETDIITTSGVDWQNEWGLDDETDQPGGWIW